MPWPRCSPWIKRFMGDPCDEILRNHSKGLRKRFYTLWAISGRLQETATGGCWDSGDYSLTRMLGSQQAIPNGEYVGSSTCRQFDVRLSLHCHSDIDDSFVCGSHGLRT